MSEPAYHNSNPDILSVSSQCSIVSDGVTLKQNTWEFHIKSGHPEVAGDLVKIQTTVQNPQYVAYSLPGRHGNAAGNLVFVGEANDSGKSQLHVFVETPINKPSVATAFYARKPRHAQVIWKANENLEVSYDMDADILYLSKDKPQPALTEQNDDGLFLRYSLTEDHPCGVTVPSFRAYWAAHKEELAQEVSTFLAVPKSRIGSLLEVYSLT